MAPVVLGSSVLLCCSCIWTYVPNCSLQCLLKSILDPITIVCGLSVLCIPSLWGKPFIQNRALYAISTISQWGNCSKGSVFVMALTLSFIVWIYHSIYGMCSSQTVLFKLMPVVSVCFLMHSNCLSARMCHIFKPLPWYVLTTCSSDLMIVDILSSFIISIVPKSIALYSVMMNGILFIYMMLIARVTLPWSSRIPSGQLYNVLSITVSRDFCVSLPFRDPKFGPSMSLALRMSCFVIGQ